jgi:peptide/nickel transport system ATP-binding protein
MGAIPTLDETLGPLAQIDGAMPRLNTRPEGCAFHPRCPDAVARCREQGPRLAAQGARRVACWVAGPQEELDP